MMLTTLVFLFVCLTSLCGLMFMSGFYSKDILVEMAESSGWGLFLLCIMIMSVAMTFLYTLRLFQFFFFSSKTDPPGNFHLDTHVSIVLPSIFMGFALTGCFFVSCFMKCSVQWVSFEKFFLLSLGVLIVSLHCLSGSKALKVWAMSKFFLEGLWQIFSKAITKAIKTTDSVVVDGGLSSVSSYFLYRYMFFGVYSSLAVVFLVGVMLL